MQTAAHPDLLGTGAFQLPFGLQVLLELPSPLFCKETVGKRSAHTALGAPGTSVITGLLLEHSAAPRQPTNPRHTGGAARSPLEGFAGLERRCLRPRDTTSNGAPTASPRLSVPSNLHSPRPIAVASRKHSLSILLLRHRAVRPPPSQPRPQPDPLPTHHIPLPPPQPPTPPLNPHFVATPRPHRALRPAGGFLHKNPDPQSAQAPGTPRA